MKRRILVIGGIAAGPSAASKAKRTDPEAEVVMFEQGDDISSGICEMPYYVGNVFDDARNLTAFTPERLEKEKGVKVIPVQPQGFKDLVAKFEKVQRASIIAAAKKFGVAEPEKLLDAYNKNLQKWRRLTAGVGRDTEKLADLIWKEIYSKVDINKL